MAKGWSGSSTRSTPTSTVPWNCPSMRNVPELLNMLDRWEPRNRVGQAGRPGMCNPDDQMPVVDGAAGQEAVTRDGRSNAQRNHDALIAAGDPRYGNNPHGTGPHISWGGLGISTIVADPSRCVTAVNSWQTLQSKSGGGGIVYCQCCPGHQLYCGTKPGWAWAVAAPTPKPPDTKAAVANPATSVRFMVGSFRWRHPVAVSTNRRVRYRSQLHVLAS